MMSKTLLEVTPLALVEALEANLQAHVQLYAHLPGALVCNELDIVGLLTDLDISENCVYRATFPCEQAGEKIEQVLQSYHLHGCLPMWWIVGPSTRPADLGKYLDARGFRCFAHPPGMAAKLSELEEPTSLPEFVIERVTNSSQLMQWTEVVGVADSISPALQNGFYQVFINQVFDPGGSSQLFLGFLGGRPVATSRLWCAGGVAGIYHVATLPEARGKGYGTVMTLEAAHAGRGRGYRFGVLFATRAGYGIYRRLGFQEVCQLNVYESPFWIPGIR
jgi:ribosomal protein S18 acetylase RimI-like enzyme